MISKMQPGSSILNLVAREMALDIADFSYSPDFVEHVPGISNSVADVLSRKWQMGTEFKLPDILKGSREDSAPKRGPDFWRSQRPAG